MIRALHTPGHRPEHTAFALIDTARGDEPWAVLGGDSLFVGDIARPDLAVDKQDGARGIFRSLHDRLLALPDTCELWPGHLGGSMCGGPGMDLKVASTIGFERAHQEMLAIDDEDEFVARSIASLGPQPPNFQNIVALNRGPLVREVVDAHPLTARQVEQARSEGALLVDVRTELQFDEAHVPGAVCIPTRRAGFGSKLAWLARADQPLVFIGRDDDDARAATELAAAVGLSTIGGYLAGGMTAWREDGRDVERVARMTVPELHERRERAAAARRARAQRVGGRAHPGLGARALPRRRRPARRDRSRPPGRGHLRLRPACRGRGEPAPARGRARGRPRRRRRRRALER